MLSKPIYLSGTEVSGILYLGIDSRDNTKESKISEDNFLGLY